LGMLPDNANFAKVLTAARYMAALRSLEAAVRNGRDDHERSQSYMSVTATANAVLESVGSPEEDLQSKLLNIQLRTEESELPLLEEITNGMHTEDIEAPRGTNVDTEFAREQSDGEPGGGTESTG